MTSVLSIYLLKYRMSIKNDMTMATFWKAAAVPDLIEPSASVSDVIEAHSNSPTTRAEMNCALFKGYAAVPMSHILKKFGARKAQANSEDSVARTPK